MNLKVSVIIPVLNREKLIERCLESIISQVKAPYEIIVVDNGSEDNTISKINSVFNQHLNKGINFKLLFEEKRGVVFARQKGLKFATGNYISFFDSDDIMYPFLLEKVGKRINDNIDYDIFCWKCKINMLDGTQKIPHFSTGSPLENHLVDTLLRTDGYIVKKSFVEDVGGWCKPLKVWNDLELGLRLLNKKPKICYIKEVLVEIFSQVDSITGENFSIKEGEWERTIMEMENEADKFLPDVQKKIKILLSYKKIILSSLYRQEGNKEKAEKLYFSALINLSLKESWLLRFAYYYTLSGFRGAWRIIRFFL